MLLIVSASAATSPLALTVSFWVSTPLATAVTTLTIPRTCSVRLAAMTLTLSVRSFHVPATPDTCACPPSFPSVPTSRHARDLGCEGVELVHHGIDGVLQLQNFALHIDRNLARQIAARNRRGYFGDVSNLSGQIAGHCIDRVGKVFPGSCNSRHIGLAAESAFRADFARHPRYFAREGIQLVHHGVDGVLQQKNFAAH